MSNLFLARSHALRTCFWVLSALWLCACQSTPTKHRPFNEMESALAAQTHWRAEGKMSISYQGKRQAVSFQWQQQNDDYAIHLFGPFGQGSTWLRRTQQGVSLENAKYGKRWAHSAEALLLEQLGWQLPVGQLTYWIRGLPSPELRAERELRHPDGTLSQISQDEWQIDFLRHQVVQGWQLPEKIRLTHTDPSRLGDVQATAIIKTWALSPAAEQSAK